MCVRQLKVSRYVCVWHWAWHLVGVQQILISALFLVHLLLFSLYKLLFLQALHQLVSASLEVADFFSHFPGY